MLPIPSRTADPARNQETVLVIDNDEVSVEWLSRKLRREGLHVVSATNGQAGLQEAQANHPIAIFLDVIMPGMDGWSVLAALKADSILAKIPVIMVTMMDDRNRGQALGVADYLMKPVDSQRLAALVKQFRKPQSPMSVLLVEDDSTNREILARLLRKNGIQVTLAENGQTALRCLGEAIPDRIVLDLLMPEMDGKEFLDELRKVPAYCSIPIVVLTSKDISEADRQFFGASVRKILQKGSCNREELLREIAG